MKQRRALTWWAPFVFEERKMRKRDFLAGLAVGAVTTGTARADDYLHGKNLGAEAPQKKKTFPTAR
jgi:hypothetical protein